MGNSNGLQENEVGKEIINPEDIIENDCYEEIDLKKINKIIEEEKNWNKNSIIYSVNQLDLNNLNEDNNQNNKQINNVILEQKNEESSEDRAKENINKDENNINKDENNINKDNTQNINEKENTKEEEKKENENENKNGEIKEEKEEKEEKKNEEINNIKETNEKKEENNPNNNVTNTNNEEQQNKVENNNTKDNTNTKDTNNTNNKNTTTMKGNHQINGKINKYSIKVKNLKPKIRPKNTSDEALRGPNDPKKVKRVSKKNVVKKQDNEKEKEKENNNGNKNENNNKTNNKENNIEEKKTDVIQTPAPVENKEIIEEFDIKNIIPEYRLSHLKDDEIIYSGTLEKILKIPEKNSIVYSQRFCIMTKNYFAYYKSKESYISLNKPMLLINNNYIIRIENTTLDGGSYYFGIICEVNDETRNLINKVNSFVTEEANSCELLLGFRTKEYESMMKWVVVLRYFINQKDAF